MEEKNIYVVGAHSTGKTTLAKALHDHFTAYSDPGYPGDSFPANNGSNNSRSAPRLITEVARGVVESSGIDRDSIRSSPEKCLELQKLILEAQYNAEMKADCDTVGWIISDRSAADPLVYANFFIDGHGHDGIVGPSVGKLMAKDEWKVLQHRMKIGLVIVTEPAPFCLEDDGTRMVPTSDEEWWQFHQHFCEMLNFWGLTYHVIGAEDMDICKRVERVLQLFNSNQC